VEDVMRKEVATDIANNGYNRSGIEVPAPLPDLLPSLRSAPTVDGRELLGSKGALEYSKGLYDQARADLRERLDLAIRAGVAEHLADRPAARAVAPAFDHPLAVVGERAVDRLASASGGVALPLVMAAGSGAAAGGIAFGPGAADAMPDAPSRRSRFASRSPALLFSSMRARSSMDITTSGANLPKRRS
jgi:hypothetical protein